MADNRAGRARFLFIIALFLNGAAIVFFHLGVDGDHLWSIAIGRWITENSTLPLTDPFSWATYGENWITHQWLFGVIMYHLNGWLGDWGIRAAAAFGFLASSAVLVLYLRRHREKGLYWFYSLAIFLVTIMAFAKPRAYYFTYFLFMAALYLWYIKRQSRLAWLLVPLCVLWANLHSMAVVFCGLFLLDAAANYIFNRKIRPVAIAFAAFLATLLTPYGWRLWLYVFELQFILTEHTKVVTEWLPADLGNPLFFLCFAAMVYFQAKSTAAFLKTPGAKPFRWDENWSLVVLSWAFLLYAIVSVRFWLFYIGFALCWLASLNKERLPDTGASLQHKAVQALKKHEAVAWLFLTIVLIINSAVVVAGAKGQPLHKPSEFPIAATEFVLQNPQYGEHMFTGGWHNGSWFLFRGQSLPRILCQAPSAYGVDKSKMPPGFNLFFRSAKKATGS